MWQALKVICNDQRAANEKVHLTFGNFGMLALYWQV